MNIQQPMFPAMKTAPRFGRVADGNEAGVIRQQAQTHFPGATVEDKYCYVWDKNQKPAGAGDAIKNFIARMKELKADAADRNAKIKQEPDGKQTIEIFNLIQLDSSSNLSEYAKKMKELYAQLNPLCGELSVQSDVVELPPSSLLTREVIDVAKSKSYLSKSGNSRLKDFIMDFFSKK